MTAHMLDRTSALEVGTRSSLFSKYLLQTDFRQLEDMTVPQFSPPEEFLACIDLSCKDVNMVSTLVRQACLDSGFFYVINHGIDQALIDEVFSQSRKFFTLPKQDKITVFRDQKNRGYTPFEDEALDPQGQAKGDCKEGYYIGPDIPVTNPNFSKPFHGPNQWPHSDMLPGWKETMEKYYHQISVVGKKVVRLLAMALNLDSEFFEKPGMMDLPMAFLRLIHYSGEVSNPDAGIFGAGAHSDYGMITMLATNGVPGLQICKNKDFGPRVWEDVKPIKGGLIVNLGDMLERWSNGIFRSTLHRVVLSEQERYSVAFFLDPNFDCLVECLPACCSETNPPRFPPITSGEYLQERYRCSYKNL